MTVTQLPRLIRRIRRSLSPQCRRKPDIPIRAVRLISPVIPHSRDTPHQDPFQLPVRKTQILKSRQFPQSHLDFL